MVPDTHLWTKDPQTHLLTCCLCGQQRSEFRANTTVCPSPAARTLSNLAATHPRCEIDKINPTKHCANTATHWMFIHTIEMFAGPKSARLCKTCLDAEFERPFGERKYYHSGTPRPLD